VKIFLEAQGFGTEGVMPEPRATFFDSQPNNGILKGVKYVQASFDQRRLTFFRSEKPIV
jgi:hypothetical protein